MKSIVIIIAVFKEIFILKEIEKPETTIMEDVEANPELRQQLIRAKKDILNGNTYTTEETIEIIKQEFRK